LWRLEKHCCPCLSDSDSARSIDSIGRRLRSRFAKDRHRSTTPSKLRTACSSRTMDEEDMPQPDVSFWGALRPLRARAAAAAGALWAGAARSLAAHSRQPDTSFGAPPPPLGVARVDRACVHPPAAVCHGRLTSCPPVGSHGRNGGQAWQEEQDDDPRVCAAAHLRGAHHARGGSMIGSLLPANTSASSPLVNRARRC
jgi:hypothetical protein